MVSMEYITDVGTTLREQGYRRVSPHFMTLVLVNMAAGHISIRHGLQVILVIAPDKACFSAVKCRAQLFKSLLA